MATLTKPQVRMLTRAMRDGAPFAGAQYITARSLMNRGLGVNATDAVVYPTQAGLLALREYRAALYAKHGSMASILDLEEVDAKIRQFGAAAQVQA